MRNEAEDLAVKGNTQNGHLAIKTYSSSLI